MAAIEQVVNVRRQQQAVGAIQLFGIISVLPWFDVRRAQIAAIQDSGHTTCGLDEFHACAKHALPDAGIDQLPALARTDVGALPELLLDRLGGQPAVQFHADARLAVLHLPLQQPAQQLGQGNRNLGQVDLLICRAGGPKRRLPRRQQRPDLRRVILRLQRLDQFHEAHRHQPAVIGRRRISAIAGHRCAASPFQDDTDGCNGSGCARQHDIAGHQAIHVAVGLVHRTAAIALRQPQKAAIDLGSIAMRVIYPPVRHICKDDACDPRAMKGPCAGGA